MPNDETNSMVEMGADLMRTASAAIFAGNFAVSLTLGISLQYLWEAINAQQLVIIIPLIQVPIPQSTNKIFQKLLWIAAVEMVPTDYIYEQMADIEEAIPINSTFEELGFEHHLILNNFGTLGFLLSLLPLAYAMFWLLGGCRRNSCKCYKRIMKRLNRQLYWSLILRVLIESYMIGLICSLLNVRLLDFSTQQNRWTFANQVITLIILPVMCLFPILSATLMITRWRKLGT